MAESVVGINAVIYSSYLLTKSKKASAVVRIDNSMGIFSTCKQIRILIASHTALGRAIMSYVFSGKIASLLFGGD
jgi:hypothetical protein